MKEYRLHDINVGLAHSFDVKVEERMLDMFKEFSGDSNPLHTDLEFAKASGYSQRVVYGMLVSSFYSNLVGMFLPGKYALFQSADVFFIAPVFPGDTLTVFGEVTSVHIILKQIEIRAFIANQNGIKVSRAKLKSGVNG